jgi:hypothetical protein
MNLILCSTNQHINIISFLFSCEHFTNTLIPALKSVVCFVGNDELPMISSLMLRMLPLQVASAKSSPVQPAARCQAREQKHV